MEGLVKRLEANKPFLKIFKRVRDSSSKIWEVPVLPNYTDHGISHSEHLIEIMDKLLSFWDGFNLNDSEILILLCSAYLHDIGMQAAKNVMGEADILRENHAEYSCDLILKDGFVDDEIFLRHKGCGFRDEHGNIDNYDLITTVAMASKGHSGRYFNDVIEYFKASPRDVLQNSVDGAFLTALLMIADELHLEGRSKIEPNIYYPPISMLHHRKHQRIKTPKFSFNPPNHEIRVSLQFEFLNDESVDLKNNLATWVIDKLAGQFARVKIIFKQRMSLSISSKIVELQRLIAPSNARYPYPFNPDEIEMLELLTTEKAIYNRIDEQKLLKDIIKDKSKQEIYLFYNAHQLDIVTLFRWFEQLGKITDGVNFSSIHFTEEERSVEFSDSKLVEKTIEFIKDNTASIVLIDDIGFISIDVIKEYLILLLNEMKKYKHGIKIVLVSSFKDYNLSGIDSKVIKKELGNFSEETIKEIIKLKDIHFEKGDDFLAELLYTTTKGNPELIKISIEGFLK
jgi:hypothetical protein